MGLATATLRLGTASGGSHVSIRSSDTNSGMKRVVIRPAAGTNTVTIEINETESSTASQDFGKAVLPLHARLPASLVARHEQAVIFAREYRQKHGDPVKNIQDVLTNMIADDDLWQSIVEEPYG